MDYCDSIIMTMLTKNISPDLCNQCNKILMRPDVLGLLERQSENSQMFWDDQILEACHWGGRTLCAVQVGLDLCKS